MSRRWGPVGRRAAAAAVAVLLAAPSGCVTARQADKARAARELGYAYLQEGDTASAIQQLRLAVEMNRRDPEARYKLGLAYFARRVYDSAEEEFARAVALRPSYPEAWLNWGAMELARGRWAEAIPLLRKAADDPTYREPGRALHNIGWAHFNLGQYAEARECYRQVLKATPLFCPTIHNLGLVEEAEGRLREAAERYRRAHECNPADLNVQLSLGSVLYRLDQRQEGAPFLEAVARLDPDGPAGQEARRLLDGAH